MTMIISEVYDAFKEVGISDEKAKKAAEALASENLATKADIYELKVELKVLKWMMALVIAVNVLPVLRQFI